MYQARREFATFDDDKADHEALRRDTSVDYALVVGINDYSHIRPLRGAIADAAAFAGWLKDARGGALQAENVKTIFSASSPLSPVVGEINAALERILGQAAKRGGHRFYFYFSGHGCVGDRATDLALCLANWSQVRRRAALNADAWLDVVVRSGIFDEVAFFFDCCRVWTTRAVGLPPEIDYEQPVKRARGTRVFLAYATEYQRVAMEVEATGDDKSQEPRGIFTKVLIDALRGEAAGVDGQVTADSLKRYIEQATEMTAQRRGFHQRAEVLNGFEQAARFGLETTKKSPISETGRASNEIVPRFAPEKVAIIQWIASYIRFHASKRLEYQAAPGEEFQAVSRVLLILLPREASQRPNSQRSASGWAITRRDRTINLTAGLAMQTKADTPIAFSARLRPGAYVLRSKSPAPREFSVHLYAGWTTVLALDDVLDPHFENMRVFLVPGRVEKLPSVADFDVTTAHNLTDLHSSPQRTHATSTNMLQNLDGNNPLQLLVIAHLLARQANPDWRRIEKITNQVENALGPNPDVDALRLRVALIHGSPIRPRIRWADPPMLREGLLAFIEASHQAPDLIPAGSALEYACIERFVDCPLTSWPLASGNAADDDWLTAAIDEVTHEYQDGTKSLDMTTIAQELGVPTRSVTTRAAITQQRKTNDDKFAHSSSRSNIPAAVSAPDTATKSRANSGPSIPGYEITAMIGAGGMGKVYLATSLNRQERVAIKVVEAQSPIGNEALARFQREIKILKKLTHERIVAFIDHGVVQNGYYFTMPFYERGNLAQWVKRRGQPKLKAILRIMAEVLDGLAYAHSESVVHRDIKPQNVLWGDDGQVVIADFGLAKCIEAHNLWDITKSGTALGTAGFMAPEQIENFKHVRPSTDVWAAAAMMYWLISGATPRQSLNGKRTFFEALESPVIPIRKRTADVPAALSALLDRALAEDPQHRPADGGEFLALLEQATKLEVRPRL
jgi:hypothetical protein